ncbi:MAG TPA: response regulator transcription factor [Nocardioidaceae bacterium]|nr:response regulator transcription factor [Nocardioidaceae bacterium]
MMGVVDSVVSTGSTTVARPRVLIVDDHELLAQTVAIALAAEEVDADLADLSDRDKLVESVREDPPDLVLLDLDLGGAIGDGSTLARLFVEAGSRVLVVSATEDTTAIATAVEQGALGHLAKSEPFDVLLDTVLKAVHGERLMGADERARMVSHLRQVREQRHSVLAPFERLTDREGQVLRALALGKSVARIAAEWVVSEATVRSQVRGVLTKLGVGSQLEAVACAMRAGWLTVEE